MKSDSFLPLMAQFAFPLVLLLSVQPDKQTSAACAYHATSQASMPHTW